MRSPSRRVFIRGLATVPFGLWLAGRVDAATPSIRYDIATPAGQEMLAVFANAVRLMKARGEWDALGWQWQWYTHFVSGATTKTAEMDRIFGMSASPERTLANEMWNTCQSHAGQNSNNFLPWHRIYVHYFEQIIRQVSGREDFTLPYWNYTSYDPAKRGIVPAQFRLSKDAMFSPLYRADRSTLANSGQPIHQGQPDDAMDISAAMGCSSYSTVGEVQGFCRAIDSGIHGRIHTLVGTSKNMGKISYAAQDPLFWVHHANVDRLWASWNLNGNLNPASGSWRDSVFVFADRNGQRVTGRLRDFFDTATLGYGYDRYVASDGREGALAKGFAAAAASGPATRVPERIGTAAPAELGARAVRVPVKLDAGRPASALDPARRRHTYLVVKDLHAWAQPEVLYHLYLVPRGSAPEPALYAGNINFFDAEFHDHGNGAKADVLGENFYSFDVTALLERIESRRGRKAALPLDVVLVPGGTPTPGARPLVGTIRLVWQ